MISLIQIDLKTSRTSEIIGVMDKSKTKKLTPAATLAEVRREMAMPRVAMSARECGHICRDEVLIVKNNIKK